jgi:hypothetical protein
VPATRTSSLPVGTGSSGSNTVPLAECSWSPWETDVPEFGTMCMSTPENVWALAQTESASCNSWPENDEDDDSTLRRTDSVGTTYAWPLYKMRTLTLPVPAISNNDVSNSSCKPLCRTDSYNASPKRMCRTLRAESECRERLADYLAVEDSPNVSEDASDTDSLYPASPKSLMHSTVTATRRWEDISDDEETPVHLKSRTLSVS